MDGFVLGFVFSLITAAIVYLIIRKVTEGKGLKGATFDERQEQSRGKGYKYGFLALIYGIIALILLSEAHVALPVSNSLALFIVVMFGIDVYACYSIMNDAYFGITTKRTAYIIVLVLAEIANVIGAYFMLKDGGFEGGVLDLSHGANLCVAIGFAPILATLAAKAMSDRRDADEES